MQNAEPSCASTVDVSPLKLYTNAATSLIMASLYVLGIPNKLFCWKYCNVPGIITFLFNSASSLEDCSNSIPLNDAGLTLPYLALLGCAILLPVVTSRKFSEVRKSAKKYLSRIGFRVISSSFLNHVLSKSDNLLSTLSPCLASINS